MFNTCIAFNGGSYGTFIEWCIHYFSNKEFPDSLPFQSSGNSHNFYGNHLLNNQKLKEFIESSNDKTAIVRFHPKISQNDNIIENLEYATKNFNNTIFLHPTKKSILWNINNKFEKIYEHGWLAEKEQEFMHNLSQWGAGALNDMQIWERREFLSLYIYKQHISESGIDQLDTLSQKFNNVLFISIEDLRDSFTETLNKIFDYCNLKIIRQDKIDYVYQNWVQCQHHKDKDSLIDSIVHAIINDIPMSWADKQLTQLDESFIQMNLRNRGIGIKCFGLNKFPSATTKLKPFLYYAT